jgi:hypothetical protein
MVGNILEQRPGRRTPAHPDLAYLNHEPPIQSQEISRYEKVIAYPLCRIKHEMPLPITAKA